MAQQLVVALTTGSAVKTVINENFTELYGSLTEVDGSASGALTVANCKNTRINNYGQTTENVALTLPTAEAGLRFSAVIGTTQAGNTWKLTADTNDKIYLDGIAGTDNQSVIVTPAISNSLDMYTFQTGAASWDWIATTVTGTWTAGV